MQNPPPNYTAPGEGTGKSSTGMDANVAALLSYVLTWVTGLIFFLIEKESRYVRFHAMQAILLGGAMVVVWIVFNFIFVNMLFTSLSMISLLGTISMLIWLAFLGIIILCCVKAYQGQMFKLPVIGDMAERYSSK